MSYVVLTKFCEFTEEEPKYGEEKVKLLLQTISKENKTHKFRRSFKTVSL